MALIQFLSFCLLYQAELSTDGTWRARNPSDNFLVFPRCCPRTGLTATKSRVSLVVGKKRRATQIVLWKKVVPMLHFMELLLGKRDEHFRLGSAQGGDH